MLRNMKALHRRFIRPAISGVYSFVFPPVCVGCGNASYFDSDSAVENSSPPIHADDRRILVRENWCADCLAQIRAPLAQRCPTCGGIVKLHAALRGRCHLCQFADFHFSQAICVNNYGGLLQTLVIKMKGQRCEVTALQLGELLGHEVQRLNKIEEVDVLTCVPTHWKKKLKKGFQASELLCESAARVSGIPCLTKLLTAVRPTQKQAMLSDFKRYENVKNAFSVTPFFVDKIKGKHVVVVDDVMTSGATASQCAKVIRAAGASRVDVAVVARGAKAR